MNIQYIIHVADKQHSSWYIMLFSLPTLYTYLFSKTLWIHLNHKYVDKKSTKNVYSGLSFICRSIVGDAE